MAREIIVGKDGKAQAVSYVDKASVLNGGCTEGSYGGSQRLRIGPAASELMLRLFPDGLANSSGVVARY